MKPDEQKRILVVDDDESVAAVIVGLLEDRFEVETAGNGELALVAAAAHLPDLVLLDVTMPGMDGFEVCRRLKEDPRFNDVPVIFLTGQQADEHILRGFAAGGADYLAKPFGGAVLEARISTHLALQESRAALARAHRGLQDELRWAGELQRRLLEIELPESERASFSVAYEPLGDFHCGGDYYDVFRLGGEKYLVILGDVSGHGLRAALITVMLKSIIYRGYVKDHRHDLDLPEFVSWLNERLCDELERLPGLFVTFLAFTIDADAMSATFCNAGQHPPCILRAGRVLPASPAGVSLGFRRQMCWESSTVALAPADRIVAYTDGLVEIGDGLEGAAIEDVLLSCSGVEAFAPAVITAAKHRAGAADFRDDTTVVSALLR